MEYYKFPCKPGDKIQFDPTYDMDDDSNDYEHGIVLSISIHIDNTVILVMCHDGIIRAVEEHESITVIK